MRFSLATILSFGLLAAAFPTAPIASYDATPSNDVASPYASTAPLTQLAPGTASSAPVTDLSTTNSTSSTEDLERSLGLGQVHATRGDILSDLGLGGCTSGCGSGHGHGHGSDPESGSTSLATTIDLDLVTKLATYGNDITDIVIRINSVCGQSGVTVVDLTELLIELKAKLDLWLGLFLDTEIDLLGIKISVVARICASIIIDIVLCLKLVLTVCVDAGVLVQDCLELLSNIFIQLKICGVGIDISTSLRVVSDVCLFLGLDLGILLQ